MAFQNNNNKKQQQRKQQHTLKTLDSYIDEKQQNKTSKTHTTLDRGSRGVI